MESSGCFARIGSIPVVDKVAGHLRFRGHKSQCLRQLEGHAGRKLRRSLTFSQRFPQTLLHALALGEQYLILLPMAWLWVYVHLQSEASLEAGDRSPRLDRRRHMAGALVRIVPCGGRRSVGRGDGCLHAVSLEQVKLWREPPLPTRTAMACSTCSFMSEV